MSCLARFRLLRPIVVIAFITACLPLVSHHVAAAADLKENTSLKFAPASVEFYVSGMRMKEVFDKVATSGAFAKFKAIPAVKMGLGMAMAQWQSSQSPQVVEFKKALEDPANQQLLDMLIDGVSNEIFIYGDSGVAEFFGLLGDINGAVQAGQMEGFKSGDFDKTLEYQLRKVLEVLDQKEGGLKFPTIVDGLKLTDTARAEAQLKRLEELIHGLLAQQPAMQDRLKREQLSGSDFLTLRIDGSLIPWPMIMQGAQGVDQQLIQRLIQKITPLTLVISIGVHDGYLIASIGADNTHLANLGKGDLLADRPEMAPLKKLADKPLTQLTYLDADFLAQVSSVNRQVDQIVTMAKQFMPMTPISSQVQSELTSDIETLAQYIKTNTRKPGAFSSCNFLTPQGYETFVYQWSTDVALDPSQELTILNHVGGDPIAFTAARGKEDPEAYDRFAKFAGRLAYYVEQIALQQVSEDQRSALQKLREDLTPLAQQMNTVAREKLAPAFADGQSALVLDAKTTSKSWHLFMPPAEDELPMLEFGLVMGVSDSSLVKEAFSSYFDILKQVVGKLHEASTGDLAGVIPEVFSPDILVKPASKDVGAGTVYYYALPEEIGLDQKIAPNAGLSDQVMVMSLIPKFTARLLAETPLQGAGPLADTKRPLAAAGHLEFARLLDAIQPWIDYGLQLTMTSYTSLQPGGGLMENIPQQINDALDVLKCFRGVSAVTYQEGDAMVTHIQWRFEDLQ